MNHRLAFFSGALALVSLTSACELVTDFDRSLIPTGVDAGADATVADGSVDMTAPVDMSVDVDMNVDVDMGMDVDMMVVDPCAAAPCLNGGTCMADGASFLCTCAAGFTGTTCETNVDDCAMNPCLNGGSCADGVDSFTCTCAAGFTGTTCETNVDDCAMNPCLNGGSCADGVDSFTCTCVAGFSGDTCATNIDECLGDPCLNGATCTDGVDSFTCTCAAGFTGAVCGTNIDDCASDPCLNGGSCTDGIDSFTCTCLLGFSGATCATNIDECAGDPCLNGATCTDGVGSFTCICATGFTGATCATNIDDCASDPCLNGGSCTDGIDSFTCACAPGFSGTTCATNIDDCAGDPCLNGGTCTDGANSFTCACAPGFSGATCSTVLARAATWGTTGNDLFTGSGRDSDVVVDSAGNIYALVTYANTLDVGSESFNAGRFGGVVVALDAAGAIRWTTNFATATSGDLLPRRLLLDPATGDVFAFGTGFGGDGLVDGVSIGAQFGNGNPFLVRLAAADGSLVWGRVYSDQTGQAYGYGLGRNAAGELLISGHFYGTFTADSVVLTSAGGSMERDGWVLAVSGADGSVSSGFRFGSASSSEFAETVAGLPSGEVVVGGYYQNGTAEIGSPTFAFPFLGGGWDAFYGRFGSDGTVVGASAISTALEERVLDVAAAPGGRYAVSGVYDQTVTIGTTTLAGASFGVFLVGVDATDDAVDWVTGHTGAGGTAFGAQRIRVDGSGDIRIGFAASTTSASRFGGVAFSTPGVGQRPHFAHIDPATGVVSRLDSLTASAEIRANGFAVTPAGRSVFTGLFADTVTAGGLTLTSNGSTDHVVFTLGF
jgi:hypothetical protein